MAIGLERVLLSVKSKSAIPSHRSPNSVYIMLLGPKGVPTGLPLAHDLRRKGILTYMTDETTRSIKSQLREADGLGCRWVILIGERELEQGQATVKDLEKGEQREVPLKNLVSAVTQ